MKKSTKFIMKFIVSTSIIFMIFTVAYFGKLKINAIKEMDEHLNNNVVDTKEVEMETTLDGKPVVQPNGITVSDYYSMWTVSECANEAGNETQIFELSALMGVIIAIVLSVEGKAGKFLSSYFIGYFSIIIAVIIFEIYSNSFSSQNEIISCNYKIVSILVIVFIVYMILYGLVMLLKSFMKFSKERNNKDNKDEETKKNTKSEKIEEVKENNKTKTKKKAKSKELNKKELLKFIFRCICCTAVIFTMIALSYFIKGRMFFSRRESALKFNKVGQTIQKPVETTLNGEPIVESLKITMYDYYKYIAAINKSSQATIIFAYALYSAIIGVVFAGIIYTLDKNYKKKIRKRKAKNLE